MRRVPRPPLALPSGVTGVVRLGEAPLSRSIVTISAEPPSRHAPWSRVSSSLPLSSADDDDEGTAAAPAAVEGEASRRPASRRRVSGSRRRDITSRLSWSTTLRGTFRMRSARCSGPPHFSG
jgi:hypothetical protein